MKIATKIVVPVLAIIVFSTAALVFFSYKVSVEDDFILRKHGEARRISALAVELDRLQAEVGFHLLSYRFRADEEHLARVTALETEIGKLVEEVHGNLRTPEGRQLVEEFVDARQRIANIQDDLVDAIKLGDADQVARSFKSWALKDALVRATLRDLVVFADLGEARVLEEVRAGRDTRGKMILTVFAATALLAAVAVAFYVKAVVSPLRDLTVVAEKIASGDLAQRAGAVERRDEVGALARAFNSMLAGLAQREALEASERSLKQAVAAAERANEAKSMFLAHMSHELRTPMNAVVALSELLRQTALDENQEKLLEGICQGSETLLATINDILDMSKIQAGKIELESMPVDLRELLEGSLTLVRTQADAKGLNLRSEISGQTPRRILGDSTRLRQILLNLLSNAVKFTHEGEVRLTVDWNATQDLLSVTVADTGIGIPEERIESLFAPFSQADVSTTREYGGTGLGLTLVRSLIDLMGGRLDVQSEVGEGSVFRFTVVAEEASEETAAAAEGAGRASLDHSGIDRTAVRILLVEDNVVNQMVAGHLMQSLGLGFDLAGDGEEAIRMVHETRYDVILMDVHMPRLDGLATTRRLREDYSSDEPWIIAMTADVLESDREKCFNAGMNDFIAKPIVPDTLSAALARALDGGVRAGSTPPASASRSRVP